MVLLYIQLRVHMAPNPTPSSLRLVEGCLATETTVTRQYPRFAS